MINNSGTGLHLLNFHINEGCNLANIKVEEVDEEVIKTETEVIGGAWVPQNVDNKELLQYENEHSNLENSAEELLKRYIVCQSCNTEYKDYCMNCGHLIRILDNETQVGVSGRAMHSVPKTILEIKGSLIDCHGVYALRNIPKGVNFGPYEGLKRLYRQNEYLWKIKCAKLVEVKGENYCNWMRYINCATTQSAQNLIALQFMGEIYYKTLRDIKTGEELLINYTNTDCDNLGVYKIEYFRPEVEEMAENIFKCPPCYFGFSEEKYLVNHSKVCPYKKNREIEVNDGTGIKAFEDDSKNCEGINELSGHHQKGNKNGTMHEKVNFDAEEKVLEQDLIEHVKIKNNEEKEKLKFPHGDSDCLSTDALKKQLPQKKYREKDVILNHVKGKEQKSNCNATEKKYRCNECAYSAEQKSSLLSHVKHIDMEKPYKCVECSYSTVHKALLLSHVVYGHTAGKQYKCSKCSYSAVEKSNLLSHIKYYHAVVRAYKCNGCPYVAVSKFDLLSHSQSHLTKVKSYKCKISKVLISSTKK